MKKSVKLDKIDVYILLVFTIVFGAAFFCFPPMYVNDTFQHENQFVTREPVYALMIQGLKVIFPEEGGYYKPIVLIQNVLAIFANFYFVRFLKNTFKLNGILTTMVIGIALLPHIMTPMFSVKRLIITNALMTEAVAMSAFLIWVVFLLKAMWEEEHKCRNSLIALGLVFLVTLIRGQMMTMFLVWAIVMGIMELRKALEEKRLFRKLFWKRVVCIAVCIVVAFTVRTYTCKIYNYLEKGVYANTASSGAMAVANVLYVAEREDGEGIQDEGVRNLFYDIYDALEADGYTYHYAPEGLIGRAEHHEDNHEIVNFDYFADKTKDYIRDTTGIYVEQYMQLMVEVDKIASVMMKGLLPKCLDRYLYNYIAIATTGFIRSVAVVHPILNWYALAFYVITIAMSLYLWKKDKHSKAASFLLLSMLMICGNVFGTSLFIQCISRYMFFTFPLVYSAALVMLVELYRMKRKDGEK